MSYNGAADKAFSAHMTTYIAFFVSIEYLFVSVIYFFHDQ